MLKLFDPVRKKNGISVPATQNTALLIQNKSNKAELGRMFK